MSNATRSRHVVIVGAGVIGASIAYHLALCGVSTTVLEASSPAAGASGASDGAVSVATKSPGPLMELGIRGKEYYGQLARPGGVLYGAFHRRPAFLAAIGETELRLIEMQEAALKRSGVECAMISGGALRQSFPQFDGAICGVLKVADEGHAIGYEIVDRFLKASGAAVRRNCPVLNIEYDSGSGRCTGVRTAREIIRADDVILAAGLSSSRLLPQLEILPQRGQLIVTGRSKSFENFPGHLFFAAYLAAKSELLTEGDFWENTRKNIALVIDPLRTGQLLIGSTREAGDDASHTDFRSVQEILRMAVRYMPKIADLDVIRVFAGIRAVMVDGVPLLGPIRSAPGLWAATGFGGDGISLAPLVGRELAKLMMNETALENVGLMSPVRFADLRAA